MRPRRNVFTTLTLITAIFRLSHSDLGDITATLTSLTSLLTQSYDWTSLEKGLAGILPLSPVLKQPPPSCIQFWFYYWDNSISSTNYQSAQIIMGDASTIPSQFDPTKDTKFLVHGWAQDKTGVMPVSVVDASMRNGTDANIMAVDWSCLATNLDCSLVTTSGIVTAAKLLLNYLIAVFNTVPVGNYIALFILWLNGIGYLNLKGTHLIGHSLGAHISGIAGNAVMNSTSGKKVAGIIGLDPAGPCFYTGFVGTPLSKKDATFVQAIHTDAGCLGISSTVGHADIYPNGGRAPQPNCLAKIFADILNVTPLQLCTATCLYPFEILGCNHFKSVYYFIASITKNYPATPCPSAGIAITSGNLMCNSNISPKSPTVFMGEQCPLNANGSYYLQIATTN